MNLTSYCPQLLRNLSLPHKRKPTLERDKNNDQTSKIKNTPNAAARGAAIDASRAESKANEAYFAALLYEFYLNPSGMYIAPYSALSSFVIEGPISLSLSSLKIAAEISIERNSPEQVTTAIDCTNDN